MNRSFGKLHRSTFRAANCRLHEGEDPVQSGLAYTPSQMFEMAQKGIPISTQSAAFSDSFDMGYRTLDFEPELYDRRGADLADIWEKLQDAKERLTGAVRKAPRKEKSAS